jgi:hypothetical protein
LVKIPGNKIGERKRPKETEKPGEYSLGRSTF